MPTSNSNKYLSKQTRQTMFQSILGPQTFMEGLVSGAVDNPNDSYVVPKGLNPEICMIAVLGAILDDSNIENWNNVSSPQGMTANQWKRSFFIRDYIGKDEHRALNMMPTISKGRNLAKEAFALYEQGDSSKLNELIKQGNQYITDVFLNEGPSEKSQIWDNACVANTLLQNAAKSNESAQFSGLKLDSSSDYKAKGTIEAFMDHAISLKEKYGKLPENTNPRIRHDMLLRICAYNKIIADYLDNFQQAGTNVNRLVDEPLISDVNYDRILKTTSYQLLASKGMEIYGKTHPTDLIEMLADDEKAENLLELYEAEIGKSKDFNDELQKGNTASLKKEFYSVEVALPEIVPAQTKHELDAQWKDKTVELKKAFDDLAQSEAEYLRNFNKNIKKIASSSGIKDYYLFQAKMEKAHDPTFRLDVQKSVYIVDKNLKSIVKISRTNGEDYTWEKVDSLPLHDDQLRPAAFYCTALMKTFQKYDLDKINGVIELDDKNYPNSTAIAMKFKELMNLCTSAFEKYSENLMTDIQNKCKDLIAESEAFLSNSGEEKKNINEASFKGMIKVLNELDSNLKQAKKDLDIDAISYKGAVRELPYEIITERADRIRNGVLNVMEQKYKEGATQIYANHDTIASYVQEAKQEFEKNPKLKEECDKFITCLDRLNELTSKLYLRDEKGKVVHMTNGDLTNLKLMSSTVLTEVDKLEHSNGEYKNSILLQSIGINVQSMIRKDVAELSMINNPVGLTIVDTMIQQRVSETNPSKMHEYAQDFKSFAADIKKSQGKLFLTSSSAEFKHLEAVVDRMSAELAKIETEPSEKEMFKLRAAMEVVAEAADAYKKIKVGKSLSSFTQGRVDLADKISKYAKERVLDFKKAEQLKDETAVADFNAQMKTRAATIKRASPAIEFIKDMQKTMSTVAGNESRKEALREVMRKGYEASLKMIELLSGNMDLKTFGALDSKQNLSEAFYTSMNIVRGFKLNVVTISQFEGMIENDTADDIQKKFVKESEFNEFLDTLYSGHAVEMFTNEEQIEKSETLDPSEEIVKKNSSVPTL